MTWRKFKLYTKLTLIGLVLLIVLMFMFSNTQTVTVKFLFWEICSVPNFAFIFIVANLGILVFLVIKGLRKVLGDYRRMRREERTRQAMVDDVKRQVEQPDSASQNSTNS